MTLVEMKQKLAALVAEARGYLDAKELDKYNKADADIDVLSAEIKAEEKQLEREAAIARIPTAESKPAPEGSGASVAVAATPEYKNAFLKAIREGRSALTADEKKMFRNAMGTAPDSAGGFIVVPAEMENAIRTALSATVAMRRLATVVSSTAERKIPIVSSFGAASWIGEHGAYPKVDDSFSVVAIGSNKLGKIIPVSEELLNDSAFSIDTHIATSFARAYAEAEEPAYIEGDGVDKPTGFLGDAQTGVTTTANNAITSDELLDLFYSLKSGYRKRATFLMNGLTEKIIRKLKNAVSGDYMWQPGLQAGEPNTLLGRPVEDSDYMPTLAAAKKIIGFGDFKEYTIKDTVGMQMQVLDQLYAENGQVGFKGFERTDGKLITPEAIKLLVMKA
ncbi:MAG: phage major capsid protein [Bacillota bacterium]